jgi:RNA polymerase sigma factor (sigma-70 family)
MRTLIERFHAPVYRFVSRRIRSSDHDVDDVVQATFAEVARCAGSFQQSSTVQVWIFGIAANLVRNQIRTAIRRRRFEHALASVPVARAIRPDEECQRQQLLARLAVALTELPCDLRTAFVLCELEDLPARQVGVVLNTCEGTIWRRVHEARRALRCALGGDE